MLDKNTYSFSKISTAQVCLERYRLEWIEGIKAKDQSGTMMFGTAVHLALAEYFQGGDGICHFTTLWDNLDPSKFVWEDYNHKYLRELGPRLLGKFEKAYLKHIKPIIIEERQFGVLGGFKYEGTPDLVCEFKGVPTVVDFKTSRYRYDEEKILLADQLIGYAHLLKQNNIYNPKQIMYVVFCKQTESVQKPLIKELTDEFYQAKIKHIAAWIKEIESRKTFPKNPRSCMMGKFICPHFERCNGKLK